MYKLFLKPLLFLLPPEKAHGAALSLFELLLKIPGASWLLHFMFSVRNKELAKTIFGIRFRNPIGLAAGFDKDGRHLEAMSILGFGFAEVGTVTPLPQPGNPRPRSFRLPKDEALINRMGFNNAGVDVMVTRLSHFRNRNKYHLIIGGNIGKNKTTPNEEAIQDYETCFNKLFDCVDFFVVNVSSPNTPGLRELQEKEPLKKILLRLQEINGQQALPKPILLKIAPDLSREQLTTIVQIIIETRIAGVVATNTTISREQLKTGKATVDQMGAGGLSGKPLQGRSLETVRFLHEAAQGKFSIIGVGGISSADAAREMQNAGADLMELYSGMIYEGPGIVKRLLKALRHK